MKKIWHIAYLTRLCCRTELPNVCVFNMWYVKPFPNICLVVFPVLKSCAWIYGYTTSPKCLVVVGVTIVGQQFTVCQQFWSDCTFSLALGKRGSTGGGHTLANIKDERLHQKCFLHSTVPWFIGRICFKELGFKEI